MLPVKGCGVWGVGNGALARVLDARVSPVYPSRVTIGGLTILNMGLDKQSAILTFHKWGIEIPRSTIRDREPT